MSLHLKTKYVILDVYKRQFQGIEDFFLGLGIQVGCDLVEEKKVRF